MASLVLFALVSVLVCAVSVQGAILSNDARYGNWLKLFPQDPYTRIPVYVDSAKYDATCLANINAALTQMSSDLNGCINFLVLNSPVNVGRDFLWISNTFNNNTISPTCASVPGKQAGQNMNGQKLLIVGSQAGVANCCGSQRDVMRYLAHILGLRNEYQRADRPITPNTALIATTLSTYGMYNTYSANVTTYPANTAFDLNSITMVPTDKYGQTPGTPLFTTTAPVGTLARLSGTDCAAIAYKYGCGGNCNDPYAG